VTAWAWCLASDLNLRQAADLVNLEDRMGLAAAAAAALSPCCDGDPGCGLLRIAFFFLMYKFLTPL